MEDFCLLKLCFVPLESQGSEIFVFSEFLASLALMVLAWTIADVRYRFRISTAPIPLPSLTFWIVAAVGSLTLLTDLWRAEGWLVPKGNLISPAMWQSFLAALLLVTFLTWVWFAFLRPPLFGKRNCERYAKTLYQYIIKGSPSELPVIADEVTRSVKPLISYAFNVKQAGETTGENQSEMPKVNGYANDLLLLIADKRFCRCIVESSSTTVLAIFDEMELTQKFGEQISTFAENIVTEALNNKDSFLYHETEGYETGLIGYHRPLSQAMFANYKKVEAIGRMLDVDHKSMNSWDANQWEAYCRLFLITFEDYVKTSFGMHSYSLYRALGYIEKAVSDLYTLNGSDSSTSNHDIWDRLRVVVNFIRGAVKILSSKGIPENIKLRIRDSRNRTRESFYDHLANLIFEVIWEASRVKYPFWECWSIQHNSVWSRIFSEGELDTPAGKIIRFKVRRLLYDEIYQMGEFPNFKSSKILGFCLNVMGLKLREGDRDRDSLALHKVILSWTKKNFAWIDKYNSKISNDVLVDGITYDSKKRKLIKTYPANGLRRKATYVKFKVDRPTPDQIKRIKQL